MKQNGFVLALAGLALTLVPNIVLAEGKQEVRRAIQAQYDQFDKAYMNKDFKTAGKIFGPECVLKLNNENRSMKATRVVLGMQAVSQSLTVSHAKTHILSIKATGDAYEVAATWTGDSKYAPPKVSKEDPPRQAKTKQSYRDTWKKTGKSWQIMHRIIEEPGEDAKPASKK